MSLSQLYCKLCILGNTLILLFITAMFKFMSKYEHNTLQLIEYLIKISTFII